MKVLLAIIGLLVSGFLVVAGALTAAGGAFEPSVPEVGIPFTITGILLLLSIIWFFFIVKTPMSTRGLFVVIIGETLLVAGLTLLGNELSDSLSGYLIISIIFIVFGFSVMAFKAWEVIKKGRVN